MANKMPKPTVQLEQLLEAWRGGADDALVRFLELTYQSHFLPMARTLLRDERYQLHMPAEDLVHKSFEKMAGIEVPKRPDLADFWKFLGRRMNQCIVDLVREEEAERRGGKDKLSRTIPMDDMIRSLDGRGDVE